MITRLKFTKLEMGRQQVGQLATAIALFYAAFFYSGLVNYVPSLGPYGAVGSRILIYSFVFVGVLIILIKAAWVVSHGEAAHPAIFIIGLIYGCLIAGIECVHLITGPSPDHLAVKSLAIGLNSICALGFILNAYVRQSAVSRVVLTVIFLEGIVMIMQAAAIPGPGRGAALYVNPNIASLAILFGSFSTVSYLPTITRIPFLSFVGVVLLSTASRSGFIVAAMMGLAWVISNWTNVWDLRHQYLRSLAPALIILAAAAVFFTTFAHPKVAVTVESILTSPIHLNELAPQPVSARDGRSENPACDSWKVVLHGLSVAESCYWLSTQNLKTAEAAGLGSLRSLLALRSIAAFVDSPWIGVGIDRAFAFRPHNTFLLFGVAYGFLGFLIVPGFVFLIWTWFDDWRVAMPFGVALITASMFSHDLFLTHELVASVVVGLGAGVKASHDVGHLSGSS